MITVVILNWHTPDFTVRSVRALAGDGVPLGRIVVVDNGSTDDSFARFHEEIPGAVLVRLDENIGFGRASNVGARTLPGSSYLMVNSDAFLHRPGSVDRMLRALEGPDVGIVAPRILNLDGTLQPSVVPTTTPAVAAVRASGLSRFVPNRFQPGWSTHWDHEESREIQAANGAVLLIGRETWDALGGFDERIHMYAEDLDICWRARRLGRKVWFVHDAEFLHVGAGSTGGDERNPDRAERIARSEAVMLARNLSPGAARLATGFIVAGLLGREAVFRALRKPRAAAEMRGSLRGVRAGRREALTRRERGT
ncbi:MAG TPA: glycosyltransferase family 2 protein [Gaiellaceae bacterium]|nr:glycosyltransferase family 2 protein [Gaiellaceae bacterium]